MTLKATLRSGLAAILIASLAAPAGVAGPVAHGAGGSALSVRVAEAADFSRLEFRWAGGARMTSRRDGHDLVLHFSRYAKPDMSRLRVDPPRWLKTAQDRKAGGGLEIVLTLADGADAKAGEGDGADFVNLFAQKTPPPAPNAQASATPQPGAPAPTPPAGHPEAIPASGAVKLITETANGHVLLRFPWKAPLGAAVFRRGDAVWVVFDTAARIDLSGAPHGFHQVSDIRAVQGAGYSAVRIGSPADVAVTALGEGALWTIDLGPSVTQTVDPVKVQRDDEANPPGLQAIVAGSTGAIWLDDPVVGDRIAVVTALPPEIGRASCRERV